MAKIAIAKTAPKSTKQETDFDATTNGDVQVLPLSKIVVDYHDNRSRIPANATDDEIASILGSKEMRASLAVHGLLQPIVGVRQDDGTVKIVAGFRRLFNVQALKWKTVKVNVMSGTDWQLQLTENECRERANPWLSAQVALDGYNRLIKAGELKAGDQPSIKRLAALIGVSTKAVERAMEFKDAPEAVAKLGHLGWSLEALRAIASTDAEGNLEWPKAIVIGSIADNVKCDKGSKFPTAAQVSEAKLAVTNKIAAAEEAVEAGGEVTVGADGKAQAPKPKDWQPSEKVTDKINGVLNGLNLNGLTQAGIQEFIVQASATLAELGTNLDRAVLALHEDGATSSKGYYLAGLIMGASLCKQADSKGEGYGAPVGPFAEQPARYVAHAAHREILAGLLAKFCSNEDLIDSLGRADKKAKAKESSAERISTALVEYSQRGDATVKGFVKMQADLCEAVLNPKPVKAPKAEKAEGKTLPAPKGKKAVKAEADAE